MADDSRIHIVMFPWLAFGHLTPFLELSKFIAQKGHRVSFVSTPRNIDRLPKLPPNISSLLNFVKIPLPRVDELPENAEATMDVTTEDIQYLKKAMDGLELALTSFLETSSPDWIIYDFCHYWLPPIAARLGVSRAFFSIFNSWFLAFVGSSSSAMMEGSDERTEAEHFTVPPKWVPFPTNVAYRLHEINWVLGSTKKNSSGVSDMYRGGSIIQGSDVIFVRQCMEFEPEWLKLLEALHKKPVIPVGMMPPPPRPVQDSGDDDDNRKDTRPSITEWLDTQNRGSVVYVALGSEVTLSREQLTELAFGLELSGLPFFWALRKPPAGSAAELDSVKLLEGLTQRTRGRGLIWTSWAPQLEIVAHESVGGFLTHCGWSSVIEGLMFGRPLVMLPFLVDQGLNARILGGKMVGIEVPRDEEDGSFTRNSVADSLRLIMVEEEGTSYRNKAMEMRKIFADRELHTSYVDRFIAYLENHRRLLKKTTDGVV